MATVETVRQSWWLSIFLLPTFFFNAALNLFAPVTPCILEVLLQNTQAFTDTKRGQMLFCHSAVLGLSKCEKKIFGFDYCYSITVLHINTSSLLIDSVSQIMRCYQNLVEHIWFVNLLCRFIISDFATSYSKLFSRTEEVWKVLGHD